MECFASKKIRRVFVKNFLLAKTMVHALSYEMSMKMMLATNANACQDTRAEIALKVTFRKKN
jgi:hypothetical protein